MKWIHPKALVLVDQGLFSGTSFLLTILIARHLDVTDFGIYSAYVLITYLAISGISAWTTQVFQVASDRSASYLGFVFWMQVLITSICGLACLLVKYFFQFELSLMAVFFGISFVFYDFCRKILLVLDKTLATLILDVITSFLIIGAFLVFQFQASKSMHNMLLNFTGVYMIAFLISIYILRPFVIDKKSFASYYFIHLNEGKWLFFTAVSQWWAGNLFVVASGIYLGTAALGALRLGQSLFGVLNVVMQAFENYVLPKAAIKVYQNPSNGIGYLKAMNRKLAYVFIPVLIFIFGFSSSIMELAGGNEYVAYSYVLKGLCVLYIFILFSQPIRFTFRSLQMNRHFFYGYFMSLAFAVITSQYLISQFALQGVIAGLIGSQIILITYWTIILQIKNINIWTSSTSY